MCRTTQRNKFNLKERLSKRIYYIPHNYGILQVIPHGMPQTHSLFYFHPLKSIEVTMYRLCVVPELN